MFGDLLLDDREVVASVMASEHEFSTTNAMVQYAIRTLMDRHYSSFIPVLLSGNFGGSRQPFTDTHAMWFHLNRFKTE